MLSIYRGRPIAFISTTRRILGTSTSSTVLLRMASSKTPLIPTDSKGTFKRAESVFRNSVTADGSSGHKAEAGRYHLYVSLACPWANRALIVRNLKGLQTIISYTVVDWFNDLEKGWHFTDKKAKCSLDEVNGKEYIKEIYKIADPGYQGRNTVPILWDKQKHTVVNNESSEIIRMLNTEFNEFCATKEQRDLDLYPESKRSEIDAANEWIYPTINNGVYRSGFATTQAAYEEAVLALFNSFDKLEGALSKHRFVCGNQLTEADVRLFTTLARFDSVYVGHFKCNLRRLVDYPNLWAYTRDLYQRPEFKDTIDFEHIKYHYYQSHHMVNPTRIVSLGPLIDWEERHGRDTQFPN